MTPPVEIIRLSPIALDWKQAAQYLGLASEIPAGGQELKTVFQRFRRWRIKNHIKPSHGLYPVKKLQRAIEQ